MKEQELNGAGLFVEPYGGGFMLADYRNEDYARYYGSDLLARRQPITYEPFTDREGAIAAGVQLLESRLPLIEEYNGGFMINHERL